MKTGFLVILALLTVGSGAFAQSQSSDKDICRFYNPTAKYAFVGQVFFGGSEFYVQTAQEVKENRAHPFGTTPISKDLKVVTFTDYSVTKPMKYQSAKPSALIVYGKGTPLEYVAVGGLCPQLTSNLLRNPDAKGQTVAAEIILMASERHELPHN